MQHASSLLQACSMQQHPGSSSKFPVPEDAARIIRHCFIHFVASLVYGETSPQLFLIFSHLGEIGKHNRLKIYPF
jgi:hypothetical protein